MVNKMNEKEFDKEEIDDDLDEALEKEENDQIPQKHTGFIKKQRFRKIHVIPQQPKKKRKELESTYDTSDSEKEDDLLEKIKTGSKSNS